MNQAEIFFGIVQHQAIKRGVFKSVQQLTGALRAFVDHYNKDPQPFKWVKTTEQILPKTKPPTTYQTQH